MVLDGYDITDPLRIREGKLKITTIDPGNAALGLMAKLTRDANKSGQTKSTIRYSI